ncbi:MAG: hypothetical protein AB9915_00095 [Candidatus Dojkabacteria bacterium]
MDKIKEMRNYTGAKLTLYGENLEKVAEFDIWGDVKTAPTTERFVILSERTKEGIAIMVSGFHLHGELPAPEPGVLFLVNKEVLLSYSSRDDFACPECPIRNPEGSIIGYRYLVRGGGETQYS